MSTYYNYYAGIQTPDGKIKPWGPFNANGQLNPIISRSASFVSNLHNDFYYISEEKQSKELHEQFDYEDWNGNKKCDVQYLPFDELPTDDYFKSGYYLIEDIKDWEKDKNSWEFEGFYNMISPTIYAEKVRHEFQFGKNKPYEDEFGDMVTDPNSSDYMFYVIPDYFCKEYEAFVIRLGFDMLEDYKLPDGTKYVVLMTVE